MAPKKKAPKAKAQTKPKALNKMPTKESLHAASPEDVERLENVIKEMFTCYDTDEDGLIERVEFLEGEEKRIGRLELTIKMRKERLAWFKAAGAEGTPIDGMFLSPEKFKDAVVKEACSESDFKETEPGKLADWIWENRGQALAAACYTAKPDEQGIGAAAPGAVKEMPSYPLTIAFKDLADRIDEALSFGRNVLILTCGNDSVVSYFQYQKMETIYAKELLKKTCIDKLPKDRVRADMQQVLMRAMETPQFDCFPVHIAMSNSAFDWFEFCDDEKFPKDVFSRTVWTPENAFKHGIISDVQKGNVESEDEEKWKKFYVIVTSTFDLEKANQYIFDKIPFYDEFAILAVQSD